MRGGWGRRIVYSILKHAASGVVGRQRARQAVGWGHRMAKLQRSSSISPQSLYEQATLPHASGSTESISPSQGRVVVKLQRPQRTKDGQRKVDGHCPKEYGSAVGASTNLPVSTCSLNASGVEPRNTSIQ